MDESTSITEAKKASAALMKKLGLCPLCTVDPEKNPYIGKILREGLFLRVFHNPFPYGGVNPHILISPIKHIKTIEELTPEMGAELIELWRWACQEFSIPGGSLAVNFGDKNYHTGSQEHIHWHIKVPDGTVPNEVLFYNKRPK